MSDWFEKWFGKEYLELYPHRNDEEARSAVQLVRTALHDHEAGPTLDLACGSGRHSRALREWVWTVGLDLSMTLLGVARTKSPEEPYVRGDMRSLPFANGAFGLVVNFFTSFGYFDTDEQHLRVLLEVARVTRPGGIFVLDYFNAEEVRSTLVPFSERVVDGRTVRQHRSISMDGRYVEKSIDADDCGRSYQERVRLFTPDELRAMLSKSGFKLVHQYGAYDGSEWTHTSPRLILFAERE